jgi:hypothetical protein
MNKADLKVLNVLVDFVTRFDSPYLCEKPKKKQTPLFVRYTSLTPREGSKLRPVGQLEVDLQGSLDARPESSASVDRIPHTLSTRPAPSVHNVLNQIAAEMQQFGTLYHEMPSPPSPPGFLKSRLTPRTIKENKDKDTSSLKELNRLARLFEITSQSCDDKMLPIYPSLLPKHRVCPYDRKKLYSKDFPCPFAHALRKHLKLQSSSSFVKAFPQTAKPKITLINGFPSLDKDVFSRLLHLKCSIAMEYLHTRHLQKDVTRHIVYWINSLLKELVSSQQTPVSKRKPSPRTERSGLEFVNSGNTQPVPPPPSPPRTQVPLPEVQPTPVSTPDYDKTFEFVSRAQLDTVIYDPVSLVNSLRPRKPKGRSFGSSLGEFVDPDPDSEVFQIQLSELLEVVAPSSFPPEAPVSSYEIRELRSSIVHFDRRVALAHYGIPSDCDVQTVTNLSPKDMALGRKAAVLLWFSLSSLDLTPDDQIVVDLFNLFLTEEFSEPVWLKIRPLLLELIAQTLAF